MKEKLEVAEKCLLLSTPYLIILSLAHYWGYWGGFGIDAVSYYGVQDLIKGFAYALPAVVIIGALLVAGNKLLDFAVLTIRKRYSKRLTFLIIGIPFITIYILYIIGVLPESVGSWIGPSVLSMIVLTILEGIFGAIKEEWKWAKDNKGLSFIAQWLIIYSIISSYASYSYGRHEAMNVVEDKYFSYSKIELPSDSTHNLQPLKYLGKAGDFYFFLSPDNKESHIVAVGKIQNLVLYKLDKTDTASTNSYSNLLERYKASVEIKEKPHPAR